jgi:hypothetical protein
MEMKQRVAVVLDVENLVVGRPRRLALDQMLRAVRAVTDGRVAVSMVGFCVLGIQRAVAFDLGNAGIRVFGHADPSPDAADQLILGYLESNLPSSIDTVAIGSGDHCFAGVARDLRRRGLRVEVVARPGGLAASLYRSCDQWIPIGEGQPSPSQVHLAA